MKILTSPTEINSSQWNDLLRKSATSSFFQTRECYDFYASLSFLKPFILGVSENGELVGIICGYIIAEGSWWKRFFSWRAIVPGGALLHPEISEKALESLLKHTVNILKRKTIYLEFRNYTDFSSFRAIFERVGFAYQPYLNFRVPVMNAEKAHSQLSKTKRKHIRSSQKMGAEIVELKRDNEVKAYYSLLQDLYKTKIKVPLFPLEFFEKIVKIPECRLFGIIYQGQVVGGILCVFLKNEVVYEWFGCGLDGKYKNIHPSTLATWAVIKYAYENDFRYVDMMGAGKPDEEYGVREFKAKFGGEQVEHGRFLFVTKPWLYTLGKNVIYLMKKINS
ncbi:MAG: aminoacyltransferase [Prevotellaceae bacterium]|jgi:hypothetical protein|nr:aminoacyltransferase [Prevotellaceae bacterium]